METSCCHELDNLKMDVTNGNVSFESSSSMSPSTYPELSKSVTPKPMDTSSNSTTASSTDHHNYHTKADVVTVNSFFNETLDLSQEDIQKTLSANMPCSTDHIAVGKVSYYTLNEFFFLLFILVRGPGRVHMLVICSNNHQIIIFTIHFGASFIKKFLSLHD